MKSAAIEFSDIDVFIKFVHFRIAIEIIHLQIPQRHPLYP